MRLVNIKSTALQFFLQQLFLPRIFPFLNLTSQNFLTPTIPTICDPIVVSLLGTLLKIQPHSSQSSRENATPSSGTSPLAHYINRKYPPPHPGKLFTVRKTTVSLETLSKSNYIAGS